MKLLLQLFLKFITGSKQILLYIILLFVHLINYINRFQKTNPTLFNVLKNLSGFVVGVLAYKLAKIGFKIDFVRLFDIIINLVTLGYVINISETLKPALEQLQVMLQVLSQHVKHIDLSLHGLLNSLDQFYKAFKASANEYADYIATHLKNLFSNTPVEEVPTEHVKPTVPLQEEPIKESGFEAGEQYNNYLFALGIILITAGIIGLILNGNFGPDAKDGANSIITTISDTVYVTKTSILDAFTSTITSVGNWFTACWPASATQAPLSPASVPSPTLSIAETLASLASSDSEATTKAFSASSTPLLTAKEVLAPIVTSAVDARPNLKLLIPQEGITEVSPTFVDYFKSPANVPAPNGTLAALIDPKNIHLPDSVPATPISAIHLSAIESVPLIEPAGSIN